MSWDVRSSDLEPRPELDKQVGSHQQEEAKDGITPAELNVLLTNHLSLATSMVRRYVGNDADVRDVVQQTALQATACLHQFRAQASFPTWLVAIAINEARQLLRKQKHSRITAYLDASSRELPDPQASPEEKIKQGEGAMNVRQAVGKLPKIYQVVLQLCEFEEQSVEQAARLLRITPAAVKSRKFRARHLLKKRLLQQRDGLLKERKSPARGSR